MAKVASSSTSEEAREEIKGVLLGSSAALLVSLDTLVAVLVVDLADLGVDERFVGVCYLDEFLLGGLVAWVLVWVVLFAEGSVGLFDLTVRGISIQSEEL